MSCLICRMAEQLSLARADLGQAYLLGLVGALEAPEDYRRVLARCLCPEHAEAAADMLADDREERERQTVAREQAARRQS
jgi:hypothetical protein